MKKVKLMMMTLMMCFVVTSCSDSQTTINKQLDEFLELSDVQAWSTNKYEGSLFMDFNVKNKFEKPVHYIVLEYSYVDEYDTKFFDGDVKITPSEDTDFINKVTFFVNVGDVNTLDVSEFLYTKLPVSNEPYTSDDVLYEKNRTVEKKVQKDFLMKILKIKVNKVVFTDKSEINR